MAKRVVAQDPLQRRQRTIRFPRAGGGRHHLHRHQADTGGGQLLIGGVVGRAYRETVSAQQDLELPHRQHAVHDVVGFVSADADVADLPLLFGVLPNRDQLVGNGRNGIPRVHVPDVQVVRAQFLKAGVELRDRIRGGLRLGFAREYDLVARPLKGGPHHALVVTLLVAARGVEIGDAQVDGTGNHARIGRNHAPVSDRRDLESGPAQRPVADRRGLRRCRPGGLRGRRLGRGSVRQPGNWQAQSGHQEVSARGIGFHWLFSEAGILISDNRLFFHSLPQAADHKVRWSAPPRLRSLPRNMHH